MLFYFINSDIRDYEDILNNQQEYYWYITYIFMLQNQVQYTPNLIYA
jgi:hypothetical protein